MAMTQRITITDNSGNTHETSDALMTKMASDLPTLDSVVAKIESCTAEGTVVCESILADDGKGVVITRVWDDASWAEMEALGDDPDFSVAGWTVFSENSTHMGLTTRQDDTFGE